jgi:hypothetical protein
MTATLDAARLSGALSVGTLDVNSIGGGGSQLPFTEMQLKLAELHKSNAMKCIKDIQKTQEEMKQLAAFLREARQCQANNGVTAMSADMEAYMKDKGLAYNSTGNDRWMSKDQSEVAIKSFQARMDALGIHTQQDMVSAQEIMAKYNFFLKGIQKGANFAVIQQGNQTLGELAKAR